MKVKTKRVFNLSGYMKQQRNVRQRNGVTFQANQKLVFLAFKPMFFKFTGQVVFQNRSWEEYESNQLNISKIMPIK